MMILAMIITLDALFALPLPVDMAMVQISNTLSDDQGE